MKDYFKKVLTDGRNADKLAEFLYSVYALLSNEKYVHHADLEKKTVAICTISEHALVCINASAFFDATSTFCAKCNQGIRLQLLKNMYPLCLRIKLNTIRKLSLQKSCGLTSAIGQSNVNQPL
ncbi:MAG: hypothetical protein ACI4AM_05720 [Muribaculaceae bacterium]